MAVVRRKQDDKNLKILREIVTSGGSGGNRQCFDCGQKGPTYVNMTIGSFVCTRCSGVLRGLTPPHRVKSISVATFTPDEIEFLKSHGNDLCAKTWLGLWDPKRIIHQDQRELMIDKYERKRYYLEPASPLKSLTNNATKIPSINGSSMNGSHTNSTKHTTENNIKNITLTPPSSLRLSSNNNSVNNNSSNNRQHHRYNFQNQFTPEENGFFDSTTATSAIASNRQQQQLQNSNNNTINNNMNGIGTSQLVNGLNTITNNLNSRQIINKNSLNISSNSDSSSSFTSNKFTPDSDFIADFGSASIFNATVDSGRNTTNSLNGYKIYQNGTAGTNHMHANNFINGTTATNGSTTNVSNANANFADFDHAPIYNAAVYQANNSSELFNNSLNYNQEPYYVNTNNSSYSNNNTVQPTNSFFNSNSNNNGININNQQWTVWQQFQSPFSTPSSEQNRWSLPMSLNSTSNSLSSSATFTSNSSINSTPPADRYAALKDLDEQLREIKTSVNDSFSTQAPAAAASPNPFKQSSNGAQQQQIGNPFQTTLNQPGHGFAASNQQQQIATNTFGGGSPSNNINYNNGYLTQSAMVTNGGINNGCGLGYGTQQVLASGNAVTNMKNPFAASSLHNSNNPFL